MEETRCEWCLRLFLSNGSDYCCFAHEEKEKSESYAIYEAKHAEKVALVAWAVAKHEGSVAAWNCVWNKAFLACCAFSHVLRHLRFDDDAMGEWARTKDREWAEVAHIAKMCADGGRYGDTPAVVADAVVTDVPDMPWHPPCCGDRDARSLCLGKFVAA